MSDVFAVVKIKGQPIRAYKKFSGEIGAEMEKDDYLNALAHEFGSPVMVLTKAQFLTKLKAAAEVVQTRMQESTVTVAAAHTPAPVKK